MLVVPTSSSSLREAIRNPRPTRASLPSRQAQSPLTASSVVPSRRASLSSHSRAVAAWEADAIEPDVSSHSSFYASVQDSLSTDGESSDHSARRLLGFRGLGLRVSLPSRRRKTFQYHVPVHLLQAAPPAASSRRQQLAAPPPPAGDMGFPTSPLRPTRCKQPATSSFVSATPNGASPWSDRAKPSFVDLADHDESFDVATSSETRSSSLSSSSSSSSRRRRAWSSLKAHAKLPRMKRTTKGMYSISFYPWKMEAHGYYSTPEAAVAWVPDTASPRCQLCAAHFTLARRRHHCRLCGKLVCNECSLPRTFLPIAEDTLQREAHRSLIKSGEAQRTCDACAATLARMVAQHDHRVNAICVPPDSASSSFQARGGSPAVMRPSSDRQLAPRPRGVSRASVIRSEELDQVLRARAQSRAANAASDRPRQHIISSLWLEQWLQFVQMDSSGSISSISTRSRPSRSSVTSRGSLSSRRRFSSRFAAGRRPGPISNYELLDFVNGTLVPREGLRRSRGTEGTGEYHVISHDVWQVFLRLYGGGPCITIDGDASPPPSSSHRMITTAFECGDVGASSPPLHQWTITELDPEDACRTPDASSDHTCKERPSRVQTTPMPPTPQPLALRSTPAAETGKVSAKRPASATMISTPAQPPTFARSTTGEISSANDPHRRRKSMTFIGYIKKWRQGDGGDTSPSRPSGASTTISQVDDDGVVLYDPAKLVEPTHAIEEDEGSVDFAGSRGSTDQRETIAAVSAFAAAAAEARRKSTMSLLRHHTTREPPHASIVTA